MSWGSKRRLVLGGCIAALATTGIGAVDADPVEVHDEERAMVQRVACADWAEPIVVEDRPTNYRVVTACVGESDDDGDGTIDWRAGGVATAVCDRDSGNRFCWDAQSLGSSEVNETEGAVDLAGGTARLHADLGTCRVDLDWVATGGVAGNSAEGPHTIEPSTTPLDLSLIQRSSAQKSRSAAVTGTVCPAASSTDTAPEAFMVEASYSTQRTGVTVDPTA